ncbi:MAG: acyltransferase [Solirubrobacteraceae bacterium]|nr:acyltransferase [Solirubrobacteraceae bacterium]
MTSATTPAPTRRPDLPSLTGMRAAAAAVVFVGHIGLAGVYAQDQIAFVLRALPATFDHGAVSLFFALSGFVLTWSHRDGDTKWAFIRRRLAKILPNHLITWTIGLILMLSFADFIGVAKVLPSLFLVHSFIPDLDTVVGTNGPNWSLAAELFFYVCFPFLLPTMLRIPPDRLWFWVKVAVGVSFCIPAISFLLPKGEIYADIVPTTRFWFICFLPVSRMAEFFIGILVARLVIEGRWKVVSTRNTVLISLGFWVIAAAGSPYLWVAPYLIPIAIYLGNAASRDQVGDYRRLAQPRWVHLGQLSFAFYLIHWLVIEYTHRYLFDEAAWSIIPATAYTAAVLGISLGLGHLLFKYVEIPMYNRWAKPRPKGSATPPTPPAAVHLGGATSPHEDSEDDERPVVTA